MIVSFPSPPETESSPLPASNLSEPAPPIKVFLLSLPVRVSPLFPPVMFSISNKKSLPILVPLAVPILRLAVTEDVSLE